jgi:Uma2 family endonuclease
MALQERIRRLTYDDYVLIPDDGRRHEILDGEHYVSPAPTVSHQRLVGRLFRWLDGFVIPRGLGEVFFAPLDVILSWNDVVQPDLFYVSRERAAISTEKNIQGAPDLVIEVLSQGTRNLDEEIKLWSYKRYGVGEYWIVDGFRKTVTVFRRVDGTFQQQPKLTAEAGDLLATPLLSGLEISLSELFAS